ncbi:hypothetical protein IAU60_003210 [Kwoniella sp. DSM 27419]
MNSLKTTQIKHKQYQLFTNASNALQALWEGKILSFGGRLMLSEEDKESIQLLLKGDAGWYARQFPLDAESAEAIYRAAKPLDNETGRLLTPENFAFTGRTALHQWIISRVSHNYSDQIDVCLEGLVAFAKGESIPMPEKDDEWFFGAWDRHTGWLYTALPTSFTGGKVHLVREEEDDGLTIRTEGSLDWCKGTTSAGAFKATARPNADSEASTEGWQMPFVYFEPPTRASIGSIEDGHLLFLKYRIRAFDEDHPRGGKIAISFTNLYTFRDQAKEESDADGQAESVDEATGANETEKVEGEEIIDDKKAEVEGDTEEELDEAGSEGEETQEGTSWTPDLWTKEQEQAFWRALPDQLKGQDKFVFMVLKELGVSWEIRGVYMLEDEEDEHAVEADGADDGGEETDPKVEGEEEITEKENDADEEDDAWGGSTLTASDDLPRYTAMFCEDSWTSPATVSLIAIQGKSVPGSVRKALLECGVERDDNVVWLERPSNYGIHCSYRKGESSWGGLDIGFAFFIDVPPAAERKTFPYAHDQ